MNDQTLETTGALLVPMDATPATLFRDSSGVDAILAQIEESALAEAPDTSTAKGRKAIASLAYRVARSKTALDEAGKELNAERRRAMEAVDAERRKIRDRLDALRDKVRAPLDEWEKAEEQRKTRHTERLKLFALGRVDSSMPSAQIATVIAEVEEIGVGESWEDHQDAAAEAKHNALFKWQLDLKTAQQREELEAENARLRAEAEERARKEAEAEKERQQREWLEMKERREREAEERRQRELAEAEERARVAAEKKAEEERKVAEAKVERERLEAEERIAAAEKRAEAAAAAERQRVEEERRAEAEKQRKREESTRIRNRVRREIASMLEEYHGAEAQADAIIAGRIPHVSVKF